MSEPLLEKDSEPSLDEAIAQEALDAITVVFVRVFKFLHTLGRIEQLLLSVEKQQMATNTGLKRLQDDSTALQAKVTDLQASFKSFADQLGAANTRMQNDLQALRDAAGSGNADAINAAATALETSIQSLSTIKDGLDAATTTEAGLDVPATPAPVPSAALTVSPTSATVAAGGTQQFTANQDVNWSAKNGTIDATGKYTSPVGTGQTADTVTATSKADATQTASASITIQ